MFQSIHESSFVGDKNSYETYYYYTLVDSEFGEIHYTLTDYESAYMRIIIGEYSKRNLNVTLNLKRFFSFIFGKQVRRKRKTYKEALYTLEKNRKALNYSYPQMQFEQYYPCLLRHIDVMKFTKVLQ